MNLAWEYLDLVPVMAAIHSIPLHHCMAVLLGKQQVPTLSTGVGQEKKGASFLFLLLSARSRSQCCGSLTCIFKIHCRRESEIKITWHWFTPPFYGKWANKFTLIRPMKAAVLAHLVEFISFSIKPNLQSHLFFSHKIKKYFVLFFNFFYY